MQGSSGTNSDNGCNGEIYLQLGFGDQKIMVLKFELFEWLTAA
jgi:hypothetical protein